MENGRQPRNLQTMKPGIAALFENSAETSTPPAPRGSKLKISIEKKIENIWLESRDLGWSYNEFVAHLLEVLVVLNHRAVLPKIDRQDSALK